jgi:hypothetical protein
MSDELKEQLTEALMLLEDNGRTAASATGLKWRAVNRVKACEILRGLLGIDEIQADRLYWEWSAERQERGG